MIYLFHEHSGASALTLEADEFKHIIKARRHAVGDTLILRRWDEQVFYHYTITSIEKKSAQLNLVKAESITPIMTRKLHLGWSMIDPKSIEKVLPSLCELGVTKITLLQTKRTQQQFKLDEKRLQRILENAMQQSGRIDRMEIAFGVGLEEFLHQHPKALILDFCENSLKKNDYFETVILGPEGGFSPDEKKIMADYTIKKLDTPMVLRSETAALSIASLMLL